MVQWLHHLYSTEGLTQIVAAGGLIAIIFIIFAETGLLMGFFLPGDSLLVTAGVLANPLNHNHIATLNILWLNLFLVLAAIIGDQVNFMFGHLTGNRIWQRPDGRLYKRKYMEEAHAFYVRRGPIAIVIARYIPIMRTFVPFTAGVARMPYRKFVCWDIPGGTLWVTSVLWLGYKLGQTRFAQSLDKIVIIVIAVSFVPLVLGALKHKFFPSKQPNPSVPGVKDEAPL